MECLAVDGYLGVSCLPVKGSLAKPATNNGQKGY